MVFGLCDDETYTLKLLQKYIRAFFNGKGYPVSIIKFSGGEELLKYIEENKEPDIIILDIKMPGINGIDVAKELRAKDSRMPIVFLTSTSGYAVESYKVDAAGYLVKPVDYREFCNEMERILAKRDVLKNYIVLQNLEGTFKIYEDDIIYIETVGRKTLIHTRDREIFSTRKMKEYEEMLSDDFFRCHRAYIVNLSYVSAVVGADITLSRPDAATIPVSKYKKNEFMKCLAQYFVADI